MIVVISIIGIISTVALPTVSSFMDQATEARAVRNAQNLVTTYSYAKTLGHDFAHGETDLSVVVGKIVTGVTTSFIGGNDTFVGVPNLQAAHQAEAIPHLELLDGELRFNR